MTIAAAVTPTPAGPLWLLAEAATLVAAGFVDDPLLLHARLGADRRAQPLRTQADLGDITKRVEAYVDGDLTALGDIAVDQTGTAFQSAVWQALRQIPPGRQLTYAELAVAAGRPRAVRAVGSACGANLIAPVVPCHRIVRTGGALGGYAYGVEVKRWLLAHEASG